MAWLLSTLNEAVKNFTFCLLGDFIFCLAIRLGILVRFSPPNNRVYYPDYLISVNLFFVNVSRKRESKQFAKQPESEKKESSNSQFPNNKCFNLAFAVFTEKYLHKNTTIRFFSLKTLRLVYMGLII